VSGARPTVVFSVDFELRWGVADTMPPDGGSYRRNLEGVVDAVPMLLDFFERSAIRATWATVGALQCDGWDEYEARAPAFPRYRDSKLALDPRTSRLADPSGRIHFAPALVAAVARTPGQELGSHTFNHIYMREPGVMRRDVEADAAAVRSLFIERHARAPISVVYPRNQVGFPEVLLEHGIRIWRDNPAAWFWNAPTTMDQYRVVRALRLADSMMPLGRRRTAGRASPHRASYYVRLGLPEVAFRAHVTRIARDARAAREGDILHLWFHPHNLGAEPEQCIARLGRLVSAIEVAQPKICFRHMGDIADLLGTPAAA